MNVLFLILSYQEKVKNNFKIFYLFYVHAVNIKEKKQKILDLKLLSREQNVLNADTDIFVLIMFSYLFKFDTWVLFGSD